MYVYVHSMYMFMWVTMSIYLNIHVHTRLNYVHTCLYFEMFRHVYNMCIHVYIFSELYVHVYTFHEKYVHVWTMYMMYMYCSIVHTRHIHGSDMYIHDYARLSEFQMDPPPVRRHSHDLNPSQTHAGYRYLPVATHAGYSYCQERELFKPVHRAGPTGLTQIVAFGPTRIAEYT